MSFAGTELNITSFTEFGTLGRSIHEILELLLPLIEPLYIEAQGIKSQVPPEKRWEISVGAGSFAAEQADFLLPDDIWSFATHQVFGFYLSAESLPHPRACLVVEDDSKLGSPLGHNASR